MNGEPGNLASLGKRLGGLIIDIVAVCVIVVPIMLLTGLFRGGFTHLDVSMGRRVIYGCLTIGVWLVLNYRLLAEKGQTIGKKVVGTRIVDLQGGLPPVGKLIALRYLVPWLAGTIPYLGGLFSLADALFIFGAERRCIHDHLAGTRVVNA
jgi:uncharacterized RDD family membrane protein YckC